MRSKADETLVIVETLICPMQISSQVYFTREVTREIFTKNTPEENSERPQGHQVSCT